MTIISANRAIVTSAAQALAAGWAPGAAEGGEALLELVNGQVMAELLRQEAGHLLVQVRRRFDLRGVAAACAGYQRYAGRQGQMATYTVQQLLWALLGQALLGLSLRRLEDALRQNLLLRWFCGFALHEPTPDHSTLGRFDAWMRGQVGQQLFQTVLAQIEQDFPDERSKPQIGDTFALRSRAADTDRMRLLRDVCRRLLACLERACPAAQAAVLHQMGDDGCRLLFGQGADVCDAHLSGAGRDGRECETACGAALCLALVRREMKEHGVAAAAFATPWAGQRSANAGGATPGDLEQQQRRRLDNWLDTLDKILADEFVFSPPQAAEPAAGEPAAVTSSGGGRPEAHLSPPAAASRRQGSKNSKDAHGRFRVASAKDLHATYRVHGDSTTLGYNIALLTSDNFVHFISAFTGARADGDTAALLITAQLAQTGFAPHKIIFDRAAGAPKRFADVRAAGHGRTQLVAALQHGGRRSQLFGPDDFHLVEQAGVTLLACPQGLTTSRAFRSASGDGWSFRFLAAQCSAVPCPAPAAPPAAQNGAENGAEGPPAAPACQGRATQRCPLWDRCRGETRPRSHRTVFVSDYLHRARQAIAYLRTPAFRQEMRTRAHIERIIAALTRYNGARRARSTGILAAEHQVRMAALAYNLKHWCVLIRQRKKGAEQEGGHDSS